MTEPTGGFAQLSYLCGPVGSLCSLLPLGAACLFQALVAVVPSARLSQPFRGRPAGFEKALGCSGQEAEFGGLKLCCTTAFYETTNRGELVTVILPNGARAH